MALSWTNPRTPAPSAQSRRSEPFGEARAACSERLASVFASRAASPQHDRIMTSHHKHHPNVLFQYPSVKPHELPNPQKGTWRTNERIQEWESRHKINCASLLIKLAQFQLSGLSSHPETAYPMKLARIKPEIYWREIMMRSARVIAVTASTTTGALSAKHTSWRPGTSRESILPVAKLNVS